jgi:hypothetical protein
MPVEFSAAKITSGRNMGSTVSVQRNGAIRADIVNQALLVCQSYKAMASERIRRNNRQVRHDIDGEFDSESRSSMLHDAEVGNLVWESGLVSARILEQHLLEDYTSENGSGKVYLVETDHGDVGVLVHPPIIHGVKVVATSLGELLKEAASQAGLARIFIYSEEGYKGGQFLTKQIGDMVRITDHDENELVGRLSGIH